MHAIKIITHHHVLQGCTGQEQFEQKDVLDNNNLSKKIYWRSIYTRAEEDEFVTSTKMAVLRSAAAPV